MSKKASDILSRMRSVAIKEKTASSEEARSGEAGLSHQSEVSIPNQTKHRKEMVRITVDLEVELHRFIKVYAAQQGTTISDLARSLFIQLKQSSSEG